MCPLLLRRSYFSLCAIKKWVILSVIFFLDITRYHSDVIIVISCSVCKGFYRQFVKSRLYRAGSRNDEQTALRNCLLNSQRKCVRALLDRSRFKLHNRQNGSNGETVSVSLLFRAIGNRPADLVSHSPATRHLVAQR